ncbi:nitroreductase family protein [Vallitalea okinawensis]|uniref:nitroreductase family protein n=1 Tax=Vallitalea okinawensis TaxID=2078660 RepID=UPI000CFD0D41|nr:nitroreductase family protein [Vallitalea okinawensis]
MDFFEVVKKRRSIRKFSQKKIDLELLVSCVDVARVSPQGGNKQPMKYCIITEDQLIEDIFPHTKWAGYLYPDYTPQEGEKPTAYIALLVDEEKQTKADVAAGIVGQSILLTAQAQGLGSCWLGAIERGAIKELLNIPETYQLHSIIALGYPLEEPKVVDVGEDQSIRYFLDDDGCLNVPKRKMEEVLFINQVK